MRKDALLNVLLAVALVLLSLKLVWRSPEPATFTTAPAPAPAPEVVPAVSPVSAVSPEEREEVVSAADFALAALGAVSPVSAEAPAARDGAERPLTAWKQIEPRAAILDPAEAGIRDTMVLAVGREGTFNAMTIGWWGTGILWRRPVLSVYVSSSRYTWEFMEANEYFTVCSFPDACHEGVMYLGHHSGRDGDKIGPSGLTIGFTPSGNPYFLEADAVFECRRLYQTVLDDHAQLPEDAAQMYRAGTGPHTLYVGEIVHVWRR